MTTEMISEEDQPETSQSLDDRMLPISPVLQLLKSRSSEMYPTKDVACMVCPLAAWQINGNSLRNYCRVLYKMTWETHSPGKIVACDLQIAAAAKAAEKGEEE